MSRQNLPGYGGSAAGGGVSGSGSASLADFKQLALLGEGAYSAVYKVLRLADHEAYALKKVKLPSLSDKEKQNALNEIRLLASIQHENVIAYKEAFFDDKTRCLCIVQECADAGDLLQQINKCKQERSYLREADVWRYLVGMCHGLKALHDLRILHRDMKCANIFLSHTPQGTIAKLGDFNVSKVAKRGLCMTQTGTPYYASPEVWRDMPYDAKSDMWSLGCVVYEMVALRPPFRAEDMEGLYRKVVRGQYPRIPGHYSQDLAEVIAMLLQVHPRHRPSVDQLLQTPAMVRNGPGARQEEHARPSDLLNTIKLPKNAIDLIGCLPKPRYAPSGDSRLESLASESESPSPNRQDPVGSVRRRVGGIERSSRAGSGAASPQGTAQQLPPPPPPPQRGLGERAPGAQQRYEENLARQQSNAHLQVQQHHSPQQSHNQHSGTSPKGGHQHVSPPSAAVTPAASKNEGDALDAYLLECGTGSAAQEVSPVRQQAQQVLTRQPSQAGVHTPQARYRLPASNGQDYVQQDSAVSGPGGQLYHQGQHGGAVSSTAAGAKPPASQVPSYGGGSSLARNASMAAPSDRGSDRGSERNYGQGGPTINPRYVAQQPYVQSNVAAANNGRPPREPRALEPRRPMSIYARQQYAAVEQNQVQQSVAPSSNDAPKSTPGSESGSRRRRSLIPRLF